MTALLEARAITKHFPLTRSLADVVRGRDRLAVHAVDDVSLSISPGETLGLIGESGSGKTTLGWILARLLDADTGEVWFGGQNISRMHDSRLRAWRRNVQVVFQDPVGSLDPRMRVWEIVSEPIRALGVLTSGASHTGSGPPGTSASSAPDTLAFGPEGGARRRYLSRRELRERVEAILPTVGLPSDCLDQYPHEFSGGGRQRLGIARALSVDPRMLVLDEPTSALDVAVQAQILNRLVQLQRDRGLTYLLITHNVGAVRYVADRVAVMYMGKLAEVGPVRLVLERPVHPYTKALIAALPTPDVARRRTFYRIGGEVPTRVRPPPGCRFATRCPFVIDRCRAEEPLLRLGPGGAADHVVACHRAEEIGDVAPEALRETSSSIGGPTPPIAGSVARLRTA